LAERVVPLFFIYHQFFVVMTRCFRRFLLL
jgi:hypothetical protein